MLKENQKVKVRWNSFTKKYYEEKGYTYTKMNDEFEVDIEDLQKNSHAKVLVICDYCGKHYYKKYKDYWAQYDNGDCCSACGGIKSCTVLIDKYGEDFYKERVYDSIFDKYGVDNPTQIPGVLEKIQLTNLKRYGVSNILDLVDKQDSGKLSWSDQARKKRANTNLEKYGTESHLSSCNVREKITNSYYKNGKIKTSSQQIKLQEMLQEVYGVCELNLPCGKYLLDCVIKIDNQLIDIEYDGFYLHKDKQEHDNQHDLYVQSQGYKILRIVGKNSIPSQQEVIDKIKSLLTENVYLEKILMV